MATEITMGQTKHGAVLNAFELSFLAGDDDVPVLGADGVVVFVKIA